MGIELAFIWPSRRTDSAVAAAPRAARVGGARTDDLALLHVQDWVDPAFYRAAISPRRSASRCSSGPSPIRGRSSARPSESTPLRWVGERSYGIYLWHWPIVALTRPAVDVSWTGATGIIIRAALTITAATLSFHFVEQPIRTGRTQKWLATLGARRRMEVIAAGLGALVSDVRHPLHRAARDERASLERPAAAPPPSAEEARAGKHPKPPPQHKHKLPPGHMLALGDSVMLGCKSALEPALDYRVRVDAVVGRQIEDTITDVNHYRKKNRLPATVIPPGRKQRPALVQRPRRPQGGATWRTGRRRRQRPQRQELGDRFEPGDHVLAARLARCAPRGLVRTTRPTRCCRMERIRGRTRAGSTRTSSPRRCA